MLSADNEKIRKLQTDIINTGIEDEMKKKYAIITLYYNNNNYGGVLQAYALQKIISNMGQDCEVLSYDSALSTTSRIRNNFSEMGICRGSLYYIKKLSALGNKIYYIVASRVIKNKIQTRINKFSDFRNKNIIHSQIIYTDKNIKEALEQYTDFICGSDQIWNLRLTGSIPAYWLTFVTENRKKIAYAPSLGIDSLTKEEENYMKQALLSFDAISVREERGKELLEEILEGTDKMVSLVLDPTLLLSKAEWNKICSPNKIKVKYIFAYFLGDSLLHRNYVKKFARLHNLKIVTFPYVLPWFQFCDFHFGDIRLFDSEPQDFISLVKNAEYVFTDSFHASVFSCIYHKEFFVFKRQEDKDKNSMNSRIFSLVNLLGLNERIIYAEKDLAKAVNLRPIDYQLVDRIIINKREFSLNYLMSAIKNSN